MNNQEWNKLKWVLMILPWLFLFFAGISIGGIVYNGGFDKPTPANPSYVVYRKSLVQKLNTSLHPTMSISDVRDQMGNAVMSDSPLIIVCPGDTVTLNLQVDRTLHIASFTLTDPESGELRSQTYSTAGGSEVVRNAELTLHIPPGVSPGDSLSVDWQAEMFIVEERKTDKGDGKITTWFDIIKPVSETNTMTLPLTTQEIRNNWIREESSIRTRNATTLALYPNLFRYFILASILMAILVLAKRRLFVVLSICILFVGVTLVPLSYFAKYNALLLFATLAIVLVVGGTAITILRKFHSDMFN